MTRFTNFSLLTLGTLGALLFCATASPVRAGTEAQERQVDQAAWHSQQEAITRLSALLKKHRNSAQEPQLLSRLADLHSENAAILYRIAHGNAHRTGKSVDLTQYKRSLKSAVSLLNELIGRFPSVTDLPHALLERARAQEELDQKQAARTDYLRILRSHSDANEVAPAAMALAEMAIAANAHDEAVRYLGEVESRPESPYYPFALYKLAWAHQNLGHVGNALAYAERHIRYLQARKPAPSESELALMENTLQDAASFYLAAYKQDPSGYTLAKALPFFKKLESGPQLGRALVRFAKLLRANGNSVGLTEWRKRMLDSEGNRPESLEITLVQFDFEVNQRNYPRLPELSADILKLHREHSNWEGFQEAQKTLLNTAQDFQALIVKNRNATEVSSLSPILAALYDSFIQLVDEGDPRIARAHLNLAETLFAIRDFEQATVHYRWIVEHGDWTRRDERFPSLLEASLKAISARYETLRKSGRIPTDLAALALSHSKEGEVDTPLKEWIGWIDRHLQITDEGVDGFAFEASRALYAEKRIRTAVERLGAFAERRPRSRFAIPSATLVIDTLIASENWDEVLLTAKRYRKIPDWSETEFSRVRLLTVASDASFKKIESLLRAGNPEGALALCREFLDAYPKGERLAEVLAIAGDASLALGRKDQAEAWFSKLIEQASESPQLGQALLARANLAEERFEFTTAARDFRRFFLLKRAGTTSLTEEKANALRSRILMLSWLSGDANELRSALGDASVCTESLSGECDQMRALAAVGDAAAPQAGAAPGATREALDRGRKGPKASRVAWFIQALSGARHLAFRDRNLAIRQISSGWNELDPIVQFSLLPILSASLPASLEMNRRMMDEVAPLRAEERYLTHRVDSIRELENAATAAMKLPSTRIQVEVLNTLAGVYSDLSDGLRKLGATPDLVTPFEKKERELLAQSFELGSRLSVEDGILEKVAARFFAKNPEKAAGRASQEAPAAIDLDLYARLGGRGFAFYDRWAEAVRARAWNRIAYFMQQAQRSESAPPVAKGLIRVISLATVGARAEALLELHELRPTLAEAARADATLLLAQYAERSFAREKAETLRRELPKETALSEK